MTKPKKPQTNPIEEAIGKRAKTPETPSRVLRDAPDQPLNQNEMLRLEDLNRQTEERFLDSDEIRFPQRATVSIATPKSPQIPVSKPSPQPETETSSQESQPSQKKIELVAKELPPLDTENDLLARHLPPDSFDAAHAENCKSQGKLKGSDVAKSLEEAINEKGLKLQTPPAEDKDLTALKEYILDNGFTVAGVAMHIIVLCAQPMVTPATPDWDFVDRANVPDLVFEVLRQPGYLEGIWPSLRIVMGTNKANSAWTAGIATTLAFFDVIRILPTLKALK